MTAKTLSRCDNLTTLRELTNCYTLAVAAAYEEVAETLNGRIIGTGGGMVAVGFTQMVDGSGCYFLAAMDEAAEDVLWIVCMENADEDGQREWVEVADCTAAGFKLAALKAASLPLI